MTGFEYPYDELDELWKTVLLHQFHDILPGSSIAWVHREAAETYAEVERRLTPITAEAQRHLAGDGDRMIVFNAAPHPRAGVPGGGAAARPIIDGADVTVETTDDGWTIHNGFVRVDVDARGLVTSVVDLTSDRDAVPPGGAANLLQLHPDLPNRWDAWDVDAFYRNTVTDLVDVETIAVVADGPDDAALRVERRFGDSTVVQHIGLTRGARRVDIDTHVDWHETETLLKAAFDLDVRAEVSSAETQYGHVRRATHTNTSWEAAKFEICAHRFLHVAEPGWGAALVNDSTYGHDVTRSVRDDGGTTTTVRLSLLRAPRFPDPHTDQGEHRLRYALVVGADITDAVREGYRINLPERSVMGRREVAPVVAVDDDRIVIEAIKLADDRSGDLVVRLYESSGGRSTGVLGVTVPIASATETDLLERPLPDGVLSQDAKSTVCFSALGFFVVESFEPSSRMRREPLGLNETVNSVTSSGTSKTYS
ncbi:Glycoside hydrolase family 38 central domain-containing protein [Stackebrandtia soli]